MDCQCEASRTFSVMSPFFAGATSSVSVPGIPENIKAWIIFRSASKNSNPKLNDVGEAARNSPSSR